jgi:competence protein ComEA
MTYWDFTRRERRALWFSGTIFLVSFGIALFWRGETLTLQWILRDDPLASEFTPAARPNAAAAMGKAIRESGVEEDPEGAREDHGQSAARTPSRPFDPNLASQSELEEAGLPSRVVRSILNYRAKGGRFHKREDLRRIFTMTDAIYQRVEPWIALPDRVEEKERRFVRVDINLDSPETWQLLPGIGSGYAGRICRFRDALGGFVSPEQVAETRGLPDSVFRRILPLLDLSQGPQLWKINLLEADSLARHPYISRKQAGILVNYRTHHGPYLDPAAVRQSRAFAPEELDKLLPYLAFDTE